MSLGFDLIGDVHGMHRTLLALLTRLGWREDSGAWQGPPGRQLVFLGDLLDRGPRPLDCLELVEALVGQGQAQMVLGNHELNNLHYQAGHRPEGKRRQMTPTADQIDREPGRWERARAFLATVPTRLLLDQGRLRVIHACWDAAGLDRLPLYLDSPERVRETSMHRDCREEGTAGTEGPLARAAEDCIKGPEMAVAAYRDQDGQDRREARRPWWQEYPADAPMVVFGHYKFPWKGDPDPSSPGQPVREPSLLGPGLNAVCVDFGVEFGRPLTAFRYPEREFVRQECLDPPTGGPGGAMAP